jgi:hypothetical protein
MRYTRKIWCTNCGLMFLSLSKIFGIFITSSTGIRTKGILYYM